MISTKVKVFQDRPSRRSKIRYEVQPNDAVIAFEITWSSTTRSPALPCSHKLVHDYGPLFPPLTKVLSRTNFTAGKAHRRLADDGGPPDGDAPRACPRAPTLAPSRPVVGDFG